MTTGTSPFRSLRVLTLQPWLVAHMHPTFFEIQVVRQQQVSQFPGPQSRQQECGKEGKLPIVKGIEEELLLL